MTDQAPMLVSLQGGQGARISVADWEARAAATRAGFEQDRLPVSNLQAVLVTLRLADEQGRQWIYNGTSWQTWNGSQWMAGVPTSSLALQPFTMEFEPDQQQAPAPQVLASPAPVVEPQPAPAPTPTSAPAPTPAPAAPAPAPSSVAPTGPTHVIPPTGLPAWPRPDPNSPPLQLAPGLPVAVVEWLPNGWARILASNGWSGWVDGRQLQSLAR